MGKLVVTDVVRKLFSDQSQMSTKNQEEMIWHWEATRHWLKIQNHILSRNGQGNKYGPLFSYKPLLLLQGNDKPLDTRRDWVNKERDCYCILKGGTEWETTSKQSKYQIPIGHRHSFKSIHYFNTCTELKILLKEPSIRFISTDSILGWLHNDVRIRKS